MTGDTPIGAVRQLFSADAALESVLMDSIPACLCWHHFQHLTLLTLLCQASSARPCCQALLLASCNYDGNVCDCQRMSAATNLTLLRISLATGAMALSLSLLNAKHTCAHGHAGELMNISLLTVCAYLLHLLTTAATGVKEV